MIEVPSLPNTPKIGLQSRVSAADRIASMKETQQRVEQNINTFKYTSSDGSAEYGLQDRNTSSERLDAIKSVQQRIGDNHGFAVRESTSNALAHNTKIINIPVLERGSLLDERI